MLQSLGTGISQLNRWERIETCELTRFGVDVAGISQLNRWERIETILFRRTIPKKIMHLPA